MVGVLSLMMVVLFCGPYIGVIVLIYLSETGVINIERVLKIDN